MDGNLLHTIKEGGGICENYELSLYGCLPDLYWMKCSVWKYLHWARWWVVYYRCSLTGIAIAGYMYSLWFTTVHLSCSLSSAQHIIKQRRWRVNLNYMPWFIQSQTIPHCLKYLWHGQHLSTKYWREVKTPLNLFDNVMYEKCRWYKKYMKGLADISLSLVFNFCSYSECLIIINVCVCQSLMLYFCKFLRYYTLLRYIYAECIYCMSRCRNWSRI